MLSVASLLNPAPLEPQGTGTKLPSSPSPSFRTSPSTCDSPQLSSYTSNKKQKMSKDGAVFQKGKIKGEVNYPPFEDLDDEAMREVRKYHVYPIGEIQEYCRHIPYNSEKKSFLEKTGREGFEVFQYTFKVPGDEKVYTVMWDYNIGLVRITPFFKCCKYSKTTPAKMLNMNTGLKEITHSITGGALVAQGYWMPYSCALAVCATFCAHIAGALIPIFGPTFPSQCVSPEAPEHGRMVIDQALVVQATVDANTYRQQYGSVSPKPRRDTYSPRQRLPDHRTASSSPLDQRLRLKRAFVGDSPYRTPADTDIDGNGSEASSGDGYFCSPISPLSPKSLNLNQSPTWRGHHMVSHSTDSSIDIQSHQLGPGPNPVLSAIPRSTGPLNAQLDSPWSPKRKADELDADDEYDGEESASVTDDKISEHDGGSGTHMEDTCNMRSRLGSADRMAAWLLMQLNVTDRENRADTATKDEVLDSEEPRIKRRRPASM
ncbi:DNA-binding of Mlu1-box binding protein MBP1 [Venustampulla echinocandica]|uniref:DNA-binding of Mlu1-box binding protein MBP1 n=1 Tax=Venustampulla echinocandica TaxID=2656787 RepID=A0A370TFU7_9HELO|nr:DNA-binding of Mlu1-box binding protein MBP1 [Venustampulla echinocandica]RDL33765.1 DNA-binding of Mlu1-box binding protein MBP1 [Venustampulla echinocandica]